MVLLRCAESRASAELVFSEVVMPDIAIVSFTIAPGRILKAVNVTENNGSLGKGRYE